MTWKLLNWLSETKDADVPLLPILEATRSGVSQWTSTNLVDFWCRRLLGYLPARRGVLVDFMRQNGAAGDVIADTDSWAGNDLKRHYNQQRLRSMVSLVRSEEHTSELQSLMRISYAVFCLKKKNNQTYMSC